MKGIEAKRAVSSTLERVWQASGRRPADMTIIFAGKVAAVEYKTVRSRLVVKINMPAIDEAGEIDMTLFNHLIAFALDELAFAWFGSEGVLPLIKSEGKTSEDLASIYLYASALEDVRVERELIKSGYAGNARSLLEGLVNYMLAKQPPIDNTNKMNVPAMLGIEGKRLNDYSFIAPDTLEGCKWEAPIRKAIDALSRASSTETVVLIAEQLQKSIGNVDQEDKGEDGEGEGEPQDGEGEEDGSSEGDGKGKPDKSPEKPSDDKDAPAGDTPTKGSGEGSKQLINLNYKDALKTEVRRTYKNPEVARLPARTKPNIHKFIIQ